MSLRNCERFGSAKSSNPVIFMLFGPVPACANECGADDAGVVAERGLGNRQCARGVAPNVRARGGNQRIPINARRAAQPAADDQRGRIQHAGTASPAHLPAAMPASCSMAAARASPTAAAVTICSARATPKRRASALPLAYSSSTKSARAVRARPSRSPARSPAPARCRARRHTAHPVAPDSC